MRYQASFSVLENFTLVCFKCISRSSHQVDFIGNAATPLQIRTPMKKALRLKPSQTTGQICHNRREFSSSHLSTFCIYSNHSGRGFWSSIKFWDSWSSLTNSPSLGLFVPVNNFYTIPVRYSLQDHLFLVFLWQISALFQILQQNASGPKGSIFIPQHYSSSNWIAR